MSEKAIMKLKFWGVRGSHPVSGDRVTRYGGNTPCVEILVEGYPLIFDAGTGIIKLGQEIAQSSKDDSSFRAAIFFSHLHHDHTQGLPFFSPIFDPNFMLNIFLPNLSSQSPEEIISNIMTPPVFPVAFQQTLSTKALHCIDGTQIVIIDPVNGHAETSSPFRENSFQDKIVVRTLRSFAHPQGVLNYRIEWSGKSIVYATDIEGYVNGDRKLVNFARGADILIHDAQYTDEHYLGLREVGNTTQGYGHSTVTMACQIASEAQVGQLFLFHHDPNYDDATLDQMRKLAKRQFQNVETAREGLMLRLYNNAGTHLSRRQVIQAPAV
ncbi:MAG: MBL fold metallo-hydrolase [Anaerolineales bacterium]|nr:MBL fold metallo-hydrolase [Chloroflexota bacterium]MBL6983146.1 MBL fold metallo-hydrolase [Anaerolineales bacterium]